jgi:hypothetical protein
LSITPSAFREFPNRGSIPRSYSRLAPAASRLIESRTRQLIRHDHVICVSPFIPHPSAFIPKPPQSRPSRALGEFTSVLPTTIRSASRLLPRASCLDSSFIPSPLSFPVSPLHPSSFRLYPFRSPPFILHPFAFILFSSSPCPTRVESGSLRQIFADFRPRIGPKLFEPGACLNKRRWYGLTARSTQLCIEWT